MRRRGWHMPKKGNNHPPSPIKHPSGDDFLLPPEEAEQEMITRVRQAKLSPQIDYTTGEVGLILSVSRETVRQMVLRWEPANVPGRHPSGLFAMRLGSHRRIPHRALVEWIRNNTAYHRNLTDRG